jgi:uncharacterized protein (TIGR02118 family)
MSVSYFVRYEGRAESPEAFLAHYREWHVPILANLPGIRRIILHTPVVWHDPFPVNPDPFVLLAQMIFDTVGDLNRALASGARAIARVDFEGFPHFDGVVHHQAAESQEVFSQ